MIAHAASVGLGPRRSAMSRQAKIHGHRMANATIIERLG